MILSVVCLLVRVIQLENWYTDFYESESESGMEVMSTEPTPIS